VINSLEPVHILFAGEIMANSSEEIDHRRLEAERKADEDVVRTLRANGDNPSVIRPVDARFIGDEDSIHALQTEAARLGWDVIQALELESGELALDVRRNQSTDDAALLTLLNDALLVEIMFSVHYDGWGTVAMTRE
jgi:regulator of RNase E activity RraB